MNLGATAVVSLDLQGSYLEGKVVYKAEENGDNEHLHRDDRK